MIALTGSSGKTSTKDIIGQLLATSAPTVWPEGSFNNGLGLPLTVLRIDEETRYLVLEMGSRVLVTFRSCARSLGLTWLLCSMWDLLTLGSSGQLRTLPELRRS